MKGKKLSLYKEGKLNTDNMKSCFISEEDLMESVRQEINENALEKVKEIFMENSGQVSVIKK